MWLLGMGQEQERKRERGMEWLRKIIRPYSFAPDGGLTLVTVHDSVLHVLQTIQSGVQSIYLPRSRRNFCLCCCHPAVNTRKDGFNAMV